MGKVLRSGKEVHYKDEVITIDDRLRGIKTYDPRTPSEARLGWDKKDALIIATGGKVVVKEDVDNGVWVDGILEKKGI